MFSGLLQLLLLYHFTGGLLSEEESQSESWLESVLGKTRTGVFTPEFEEENNTLITVRDGETALLDCKVFMLKDKMVSWLRRTGGRTELLTVGESTYTGDSRIMSSPQYPNNWRLNISDIRTSDSGTYLCQISTHPPTLLHKTLHVQEAIVEILGDWNTLDPHLFPGWRVGDKFYNPGSDIELSCVVRRGQGQPLEVFTNILWRKDEEVIDLHKSHSVSVGTQVESERVVSRLVVKGAVLTDSGRYSCSLPLLPASHLPRAAVNVHVIKGDHLAVYGTGSSLYVRAVLFIFCEMSVSTYTIYTRLYWG